MYYKNIFSGKYELYFLKVFLFWELFLRKCSDSKKILVLAIRILVHMDPDFVYLNKRCQNDIGETRDRRGVNLGLLSVSHPGNRF